MSVLGTQIKKFRMAKGITQEQLGQLVGVTTQAVSKWERGGTPDAELLPALSEALGVSIDALFGREEQSVAFSLARKLSQMDREDMFRYAFEVCWSILHGVMMETPRIPDDQLRVWLDQALMEEEPLAKFSKIHYDEGMINIRADPDLRFFFMMLEPEKRLRPLFSDLEGMRRVFAALADPDKLRILFYLYTRLNTPIATSLISKNTGLSIQEVDRHMEDLRKAFIVKRTAIATAEGEIYSYMFQQEDAVVALLCLADEIRYNEDPNLFWSMDRHRPIMG
ncbi:MAG: helix-turn-helix domain-containing protein [Oscillospiraceae bacterium]|nr:helix-turn-helix domain-containing protein [Oscillospiraceae bacterium]